MNSGKSDFGCADAVSILKRPTFAAQCLRLAVVLMMSTVLAGCDVKATMTTPADTSSVQAKPLSRLDLEKPVTRIRVRTSAVTQRSITAGQSATGVVRAFRKSVVAAETGGSVTRRYIEPGALVTAGQVLLELDAQRSQIALDRATAEAQARQVDYAQAEHELLRGRRLIERNVISQDTLDDLRFNLDRAHSVLAAAKSQRDDAARMLADSKVRAPFAGTVEFVHVQTGDYLSPGTPVATIADFSKVRVVAGITAEAATSLSVNAPTSISLGAGHAASVEGTIKSIGRIADSNGTFPLELWVTGKEAGALREGMVATVQLPQSDQQKVVGVPRAALLRRDGAMQVYVFSRVGSLNENQNLGRGQAELRTVTLGRSDANYTQVTTGLSEGENVIVDGLFALRDGALVELLE